MASSVRQHKDKPFGFNQERMMRDAAEIMADKGLMAKLDALDKRKFK